ncbi:MAG: thiol-disulfide oxidoreductase [Robiginitomaculum sp.]|nr:MAG: thiol-disulfide oxidoreductase [Robiginitomaculum sp.]
MKVPDFNDAHPLIVFDGVCHFCSRSMQILFEHEKGVEIHFTQTRSSLGRALLRHYHLDPDDPVSFLFLYQGKASQSSAAIFSLCKHLKGWPRLVRYFWIIPRPVTNLAYRILARNRYKIFGKSDVCLVPSAQMQKRLLDPVKFYAEKT